MKQEIFCWLRYFLRHKTNSQGFHSMIGKELEEHWVSKEKVAGSSLG